MIDGCAKFTYLTCKQNPAMTLDKNDNPKENVWLNLLIVDAYNAVPQVAHFKSKKVFDLATKNEFEDVIK
jgi:hypothetical protein